MHAALSAQPAAAQHIGFADTLLFNDGLRYQAFGYDGPAPLFVQAWFPLSEPSSSPLLTYGQLREPGSTGSLQRVHQELVLRMDSAFMEYDLRYAFNSDTTISYAPYGEHQVMDSLFAQRSAACRAPWSARRDGPVVVYHHGSQGLCDENAWMAERFARSGFTFLSCNWHWPLEGRPYGYPLEWKPDAGGIRTMLRFARQISGGSGVFYIGHSWGAQEGWSTLYEPGLVDGFISLETTMEWKTDSAEVRDKWPNVLEAISTQRYAMPIMMVADTDGKPPFPMFRGVRANIRYLDPRTPFGHESYTSAFLMRLNGAGRFAVPDHTALSGQAMLYDALLLELLAFLQELSGMQPTRPDYPQGDPFHRW